MRNPATFAAHLIQPLWSAVFVLHGLLLGGWSPASVLVCFWFERLTRNMLTVALIYAHRKARNQRGHYRAQMNVHGGGLQVIVTSEQGGTRAKKKPRTTQTEQPPTLLGEFTMTMILTEVMVIALLAWQLTRMDDWTGKLDVLAFVQQEWRSKAWIVVLPMVIGFAIEMLGPIGQRSFAWMRETAIVNMRSGNLILTAALLGVGLAHFTQAPNVLILAGILVAAKGIYEGSLTFFGRDWEMRLNDSIAAGMSDEGRQAVQAERKLRQDDELPMDIKR
jgi:hypothetical protein